LYKTKKMGGLSMRKAKRLIALFTVGLTFVTGTIAGCGKKDGADNEGRKPVQKNSTNNLFDGENGQGQVIVPGTADDGTAAKGAAIVAEGQSQAKVVLLEFDSDNNIYYDPNWSYRTPYEIAGILVKYVEKSTGAKLPIVKKEPEDYDGIKIYMGVSSAKDREQHPILRDLNEQGFIIDSQEGKISIIGNSLDGLKFGVYEFLERYAGISWLMPGPEGEEIPQHSTLIIPYGLVKDQPKTISRFLYTNYNKTIREWERFMRMNSSIAMHHNMYELFDPEVFKDHPEYYVGGELPTSLESWQPRFNDETAQAAIERIIEYFDKNPSQTSYSLGINDLGYEYEPAPTEKNSVGTWNVSDVYYPWVDKIARGVLEKHPGKYFGLLAYRELYDPPKNADGSPYVLSPSVIPYITDDRMTWCDEDMGRAGRELTERWLESATQIGFYEYLYGFPYNIPRVYIHHMGDLHKYAQDNGVIGYFAELNINFAEGPKAWVAAKLLWNADQDVDALLQQWCEKAVGADAAQYLKQYYEYWEEFWTSRVFQSEWYQNWKNQSKRNNYLTFNDYSYLKEVTKEDIKICRSLMEKVVELAGAGTASQKTRAELLMLIFEFCEASALSYPKDRPAMPATEQAALELLEDVKVSYEMALKRERLSKKFTGHPFLDLSLSSFGGEWDGIQSQAIYVLQSYAAGEPEGGTVREALNEFLKKIPGFKGIADKLSAYAVKTSAGKSAILESLDFSTGPWAAAEPFSDFMIKDAKATPPVNTNVYLLWDDENLYVGYENFFNDVKELVVSDANSGWWSSGYDDSNETYITADLDSEFKGFFANPNADKIAFTSTGPTRVTAGLPWEANAIIRDDRWNLVQVIPFSSIGIGNPKEYPNLYGFFLRNHSGAAHTIGWGGGVSWNPKHFNPVHLVESKNLVGNPSFEDGTGDVLAPWNYYVISPSYVKRSNDLAVTGNYSMMADGLYGGMSTYQVIHAEPGKYRASFYYFMAGNAATQGKIQWFTQINSGEETVENIKSEQVPLDWTKGVWEHFEFEYKIKAGYNKKQPTRQCIGIAIWKTKPGERVYIDDVAVYKVE
jgi:hypothetical protein